MSSPDPKEKPAQQESPAKNKKAEKKKESINQPQNWNEIRDSWTQRHAHMAEAKAMAMLDVKLDDDDLGLAQHLLFFGIVGFFVLFVIWANFAQLDEVTRGDGKVIPSSEVQQLQSLEAGIVEEFLVKEGGEVSVGQVLMRLSDIEASSDLGASRARYLGLLASITRLQAEAKGESTLTFPNEVMEGSPSSVSEEMNAFRANKVQRDSQLNVLTQQKAQREQEVRELQTRISDLREVVRLQREEMEMIRPLVEKGAAPQMELLQLERGMKERDSELNSLLSSLPRAQSAVSEVNARIDDLNNSAQADAQTELSAKLIELNEIKERLSALKERKTRTEIKSPVNGTIKEFTVNTVGGVVRPGETLIEIVPKDDQLLIEARIRPSDIAHVYPTQAAIVKITAYDFSIYGGLESEVVDISADTIEDEQGNSFYRVRLRTNETELKRKGEILPIIPGMVASVDILTGKKTVMQYLLKPFVKTLDNAMTER